MRVLCVCGQRGAAAGLAPVVCKGRQVGWFTSVLTYGEAGQWFDDTQIPCEMVAENLSLEAATELILKKKADVLLLGTDASRHVEKRFMRAARSTNALSIAYLDFWSNYLERFVDDDGVMCIPDRIAVVDEQMFKELKHIGIPGDRMVITGSPGIEQSIDAYRRMSGECRYQLRRKNAIGEEDFCVLFVSTPLSSEDYSAGASGCSHSLLLLVRDVLSHLDQYAQTRAKKVHLFIRPHPRETGTAFQELKGGQVFLHLIEMGNPLEWIEASDIVVGLDSMLLIEAASVGKPVISLDWIANLTPTAKALFFTHAQVAENPSQYFNLMESALEGDFNAWKRSGKTPVNMHFGAGDRLVRLVNHIGEKN